MNLNRIYLFCSLTNSVFVERGSHRGDAGYWFADNVTHQRVFLTDAGIEAALQQGTRHLDALPQPRRVAVSA